MNCLYILEIKLLFVASFCKYVFQSLNCLSLFMVSFAVKKTQFDWISFVYFAFISAALGD